MQTDVHFNLANKHLRKVDPVMGKLVKQKTLYTPDNPQKKKPPHFHWLIQSIINQQLSVSAAKTISDRTLIKMRGRYFHADDLLGHSEETLKSCGLSKNKIRYILNISHAVKSGELNFRKLIHKGDDDVRKILISLPGVGDWTADLFMMFSLGRQDIFPVGDLIIRKIMRHHYDVAEKAKYDEYEAIAEKWRPFRSYASRYLWASKIK